MYMMLWNTHQLAIPGNVSGIVKTGILDPREVAGLCISLYDHKLTALLPVDSPFPAEISRVGKEKKKKLSQFKTWVKFY